MAIGVHFFGQIFAEILAAVVGDKQGELQDVNALIVCRIDTDLTEIKRAWVDRTHPYPFFATVFGPENTPAFTAQVGKLAGTAFVALHHRHHDLWIAPADCETDTARPSR